MNALLKTIATAAALTSLSGCVVTSGYVGYHAPYVRPYYAAPAPIYYAPPPVFIPPPVYVMPPRYGYGYRPHHHYHRR